MPELNANLSIERLCFLAIQETFIVAKQRPWTFLVLWVCGLQDVLALGLQCFTNAAGELFFVWWKESMPNRASLACLL